MYTTIEIENGQEVEFRIDFRNQFKGRGCYDIIADVLYFPSKKDTKRNSFKHFTTDAPFIDSITEMKADDLTSDELDQAYFDRFFNDFEERVIEWLRDLKEEEKEEN